MISNKPYLLRAFHQWIVDSACTPILVIDAKQHRRYRHDESDRQPSITSIRQEDRGSTGTIDAVRSAAPVDLVRALRDRVRFRQSLQ